MISNSIHVTGSLKRDQQHKNTFNSKMFKRSCSKETSKKSNPIFTTMKLIVRAETKPHEKRSPITPEHCSVLIKNGFEIDVECSNDRIFEDQLFEGAGCVLVPAGSWKSATKNTYIFGLKELEEDTSPIQQHHIYFSHCYKYQSGWKNILQRFKDGKGEILDVEFMVNNEGQRVVAEFAPMAGISGCILAIDLWCHQKIFPEESYPSVQSGPSQIEFCKSIQEKIKQLKIKGIPSPKILIIGALGRCGKGALSFAVKAGIPSDDLTLWDLPETKNGGPFPSILEYDIMINCVFIGTSGDTNPPPFLTCEMLKKANRKLNVIVDVSCDIGNPKNPLPFIEINTTFDKPTIRSGNDKNDNLLDIISIDHLPSLLPKESSDRFSEKILPYLLELKNREKSDVWKKTAACFKEKTLEI